MTLILALLVLVGEALAQACVCSRNVALPSGSVLRPWAGVFTVDYGMSLSGEAAAWDGFSVTDRYGDSMAGMYMAPHLVQTSSFTAALGLPAHFSASMILPYMNTRHRGESEMPGDVDARSLADAELVGKWGHPNADESAFFGLSAGLSFPTGEVIPDSPVRAGRGTFGSSFGVNGGMKVRPKVGIAAQLSGSAGFGPDSSGYTVGPSASLVAGARWSPRENGRFNLALFGMERWAGTDHQDALVYRNTGYLTTDLAAAAGYTFWEKALRSASITLRGQVPVFQIVGDPMYTENVALSLAVGVVAF